MPIYNVYTYATVKRRYVVNAENQIAAEGTIAGRDPTESEDLSEVVRAVCEYGLSEETSAEVIEMDANGKPKKCSECGEPLVDGQHLPDPPCLI